MAAHAYLPKDALSATPRRSCECLPVSGNTTCTIKINVIMFVRQIWIRAERSEPSCVASSEQTDARTVQVEVIVVLWPFAPVRHLMPTYMP